MMGFMGFHGMEGAGAGVPPGAVEGVLVELIELSSRSKSLEFDHSVTELRSERLSAETREKNNQ